MFSQPRIATMNLLVGRASSRAARCMLLDGSSEPRSTKDECIVVTVHGERVRSGYAIVK